MEEDDGIISAKDKEARKAEKEVVALSERRSQGQVTVEGRSAQTDSMDVNVIVHKSWIWKKRKKVLFLNAHTALYCIKAPIWHITFN